jgi:hypothetical protein
MTGRAHCMTGYVLIKPLCIDQLSPAPQSVHTDAPAIFEYLPAHQRQGSVGALALVRTLLRHRKSCMHQPSTSACIRLGNDAGRNQIGGLVCPLPIYPGGASFPHPHPTHIHTLRALSPQNLWTHPRDMPCTRGSPSWRSESENCSDWSCTLTQT